MIDEDDRRELADLAFRALDTIADDYGDDAQLHAACLVFEVSTPDEDEPDTGPIFHGNYKSLARNSPHHIAGLLDAVARHTTST